MQGLILLAAAAVFGPLIVRLLLDLNNHLAHRSSKATVSIK